MQPIRINPRVVRRGRSSCRGVLFVEGPLSRAARHGLLVALSLGATSFASAACSLLYDPSRMAGTERAIAGDAGGSATEPGPEGAMEAPSEALPPRSGSADPLGDTADAVAPAASTPAPTGNGVPTLGLVAHYRGSGVDLSGNGHDATPIGNVTLAADRFGKPGLAAELDGKPTTYFEATGHTRLPLGKSTRTVAVWIRTTHDYSAETGGALWNWGSSAETGARFGLGLVDNRDYIVGERADLGGRSTVNDGKWHNLIVAYDGAVATSWVDDRLSAMGVITISTKGTNLGIGRSTFDHIGDEPFEGNIDDLRIYDRVLTSAERTLLFAEGGWH